MWNPLVSGLPDEGVRLRFADEDNDGRPLGVVGTKWFVNHYSSLRKRTRNLSYAAFFFATGAILIAAVGVRMMIVDDDFQWWLLTLCMSVFVTGVYFVPAGVLLLRMSKKLASSDFRLFMVVSRVFMVLPLLCGVVMYVVADRDWSLVILAAAFWVLPQMYVNAMRQFVVVMDDEDLSDSVVTQSVL